MLKIETKSYRTAIKDAGIIRIAVQYLQVFLEATMYQPQLFSIVAVIFILCNVVNTQTYPCELHEAVELPSTKYTNNLIHHEGISYNQSTTFQINGTLYGCICHHAHCKRKCCSQHQIYVFNDTTKMLECTNEKPTKEHDVGNYTHFGDICPQGKYRMEPDDKIKVAKNGVVTVLYSEDNIEENLTLNQYCIEIVEMDNKSTVDGFVCFSQNAEDEDSESYLSYGNELIIIYYYCLLFTSVYKQTLYSIP